ncbi:MAG TPA: hypothetical protein VFX30_14155 [bacterium]|nr:hypothetical protein [bacterium]
MADTNDVNAHNAANNAEVMAAYERLWEMQQQEMEKARAENEGAMMSQMALHEAGQGAEDALSYMLEWQQTVNGRAEATAEGLPPPEHMDSEILFSDGGSNESRWDVMGDIFGNNGNDDPSNGGFSMPGP